MEALGTWFARELEMITQAPVLFLTTVTAVGFVIWKVMEWHFKGRLEDASSRSQLLQDRVDDYKTKLSGASPDEAKVRLDALEAALSAIAPKRISDSQRAEMIGLLSPYKGSCVLVGHDMASAHGGQLATSMRAIFQAAGWVTQSSMVSGLSNSPPSGAALFVNDPAAMTPAQKAVERALQVAGIEFDLARGMQPSRPGAQPTDAELLFTTRLRD